MLPNCINGVQLYNFVLTACVLSVPWTWAAAVTFETEMILILFLFYQREIWGTELTGINIMFNLIYLNKHIAS